MAIYLGIDGGGTKTACVVGDDLQVLGHGSAGPSNLLRTSAASARIEMRRAIEQACHEARIKPSQVTRAVVGLAGAARPEICRQAHQILSEILSAKIHLVGDMEVACHAAFGDSRPGVIVIAGTGSIAFGRDSSGASARAGGWGFAVSDEGSAAWIGRTALAAALRLRDQGGDPSLLRLFQNAWKLNSFDDLIVAANATPPADFAALFSVVASAADAGDEAAQSVLSRAGDQLAQLVAVVVARLFAEKGVTIAMAGGVFQHSLLVREVFSQTLSSLHNRVVVDPVIVKPVDGALAMARSRS